MVNSYTILRYEKDGVKRLHVLLYIQEDFLWENWIIKWQLLQGGNAGVGKEIAKLFASEGAKVVISARRQQVLEEAAKEIEAAGGTVLCVPTDISKVDDVKNLVSKTGETFGQLDILINNAGVLDKGLNAIDQIDYDDLNRVIDINQKGTMYCMSEAL